MTATTTLMVTVTQDDYYMTRNLLVFSVMFSVNAAVWRHHVANNWH